MKEILVGIFGTTAAPLQWYLFGLGVLLAIILKMAGLVGLVGLCILIVSWARKAEVT